jgi:hypothetical protein
MCPPTKRVVRLTNVKWASRSASLGEHPNCICKKIQSDLTRRYNYYNSKWLSMQQAMSMHKKVTKYISILTV